MEQPFKVTRLGQLKPDAARLITQICVRAILRGRREAAEKAERESSLKEVAEA